MSDQEQDPIDALGDLFNRARTTDEFEFVCTLLRIRGMEDRGWDTLEESWALINQVIAQTEAPTDGRFRLRLLLFLYCHVTEMHDLYHLVGNLLRVILGDRYTMNPFAAGMFGHRSGATTPATKVVRIQEWANDARCPEVGELLDRVLLRQVRNAFFHSDYVLHGDEFRIKRGGGALVDGRITRVIPLEWLLPRIELATNTVLALVDLLRSHIASYREPKVLTGRFRADGGLAKLELIVEAGYGVVGFRSLPEG